MKIGYYPGCSLKGSGKEYEISLKTLMNKCDVELIEIEDWNCCGASSAHSINHMLSIALEFSRKYPKPKQLFEIHYLGGWEHVYTQLYGLDGVWTKIMEEIASDQ